MYGYRKNLKHDKIIENFLRVNMIFNLYTSGNRFPKSKVKSKYKRPSLVANRTLCKMNEKIAINTFHVYQYHVCKEIKQFILQIMQHFVQVTEELENLLSNAQPVPTPPDPVTEGSVSATRHLTTPATSETTFFDGFFFSVHHDVLPAVLNST